MYERGGELQILLEYMGDSLNGPSGTCSCAPSDTQIHQSPPPSGHQCSGASLVPACERTGRSTSLPRSCCSARSSLGHSRLHFLGWLQGQAKSTIGWMSLRVLGKSWNVLPNHFGSIILIIIDCCSLLLLLRLSTRRGGDPAEAADVLRNHQGHWRSGQL